jgi:hypothetical protein
MTCTPIHVASWQFAPVSNVRRGSKYRHHDARGYETCFTNDGGVCANWRMCNDCAMTYHADLRTGPREGGSLRVRCVMSSKYRMWSGAASAECKHAETNARAGEAKVASRGRCQDNAARPSRVCHARAGWHNLAVIKATDAGWSIYRSNLGTPSRSTHGPNYSACRQRSHGDLPQCDRVRTARQQWERKHS